MTKYDWQILEQLKQLQYSWKQHRHIDYEEGHWHSKQSKKIKESNEQSKRGKEKTCHFFVNSTKLKGWKSLRDEKT